MQILKAKLFIAIVTALFFAPAFANAQETTLPELNPVCWKKSDCVNARKQYGIPESEINNGFLVEFPCNSKPDWGKCLPAGVTETSVALGGEKKFANFGVYLITVYKYALTVASILAVVVIIFSGMQWIASGGNSETINSSKK